MTELQQRTLSLVLKYCITPSSVNLLKVKTEFEKLYCKLGFDKSNACNKFLVKKALNNAHNFFTRQRLRILKPNLSGNQIKCLRDLSKNKDIVIMKPDKGVGVVILNSIDYKRKMYDILNDKTKFTICSNDISAKREVTLNNLLRKILKNGNLTDKLYKDLYSVGARPGIMYGLPKTHKQNVPLRPIISSIGTFSYKTAKYLAKILSPLAQNSHLLKNSNDFINRLNKLKLRNSYMVSFYVESLFTIVPLDYTINLILERIYQDKELDILIPEHDLKRLLELCTKDNIFLFNGLLYQQIDGVAMGSPLGPLLANVFMSHVEKLLFNSELKKEVNFWVRYVDDIFVIFDKVNPNINSILAFLNNIHRNIKFTVEHETNHCLHFLDIDIKFSNGVFTTCTYNKPTSTDLYTMWNSFCPLSYKLSTIRSLFNRSIKLCSDSSVLLKEKLKLINNFHVNLDYPLHVLYDMYNVCCAFDRQINFLWSS